MRAIAADIHQHLGRSYELASGGRPENFKRSWVWVGSVRDRKIFSQMWLVSVRSRQIIPIKCGKHCLWLLFALLLLIILGVTPQFILVNDIKKTS